MYKFNIIKQLLKGFTTFNDIIKNLPSEQERISKLDEFVRFYNI
jgi:hypothetical protein